MLKEDEVPWASEWGGKILFSHGTKHSKGIGIHVLQRPNSLFSFKCLSTDPNGRLVIAKIKLGDEDFFLAFVYAPCDSQQQYLFIQNLCTDIVSKPNISRIIIAGDWNTTEIHSIDKCGGCPWQETSYGNSRLSLMDELGLVNVYRVLHPKKKAMALTFLPGVRNWNTVFDLQA